ncbi:MAG: hypothetical protein QXG03_07660, partial [Halalkalicoccus sp.]
MEALSRYEPIVEEFEAFLDACERPLPSVVRVNTIKAGVERTKRALDAEEVGYAGREWNPTVLELDTDKPGNTWPYFHGWIHGQEEISSLPAIVLDPQPGERVLDACAAPGGKTAQIAALMDDTGVVVANDNDLGRLSDSRNGFAGALAQELLPRPHARTRVRGRAPAHEHAQAPPAAGSAPHPNERTTTPWAAVIAMLAAVLGLVPASAAARLYFRSRRRY